MADNYNAIYKRFNGSDWDTFYFATLASQVSETQTRKWLTDTQQTNLNNFLVPAAFNTANKLLQLDGSGNVPIGLIPGGLDYLPTKGGTLDGGLSLGGYTINNVGEITTNSVVFDDYVDIGTSSDALRIRALGQQHNKILFEASRVLMGDDTLLTTNDINVYGTINISEGAGYISASGPTGIENLNIISENLILESQASQLILTAPDGISVDGKKITDVADGSNDKDAVNYGQLLSVAMDGLKPMPPVRVATTPDNTTTGNITTSGLLTVDGVQLVAGDRVLVKNQTTSSQNGIYTVNSGTWTKVTAQSQKGFYGQVLEGEENRGRWYYADTNTSWELHSMPDEYGVISGGGLQLVGMNFGIEAGKVTNAMLAGSINTSKLLAFTSTDNNAPTSPNSSKSLTIHIAELYSQIKRIRGTATFNTTVTDTILSVKGIAESKNKTYRGSAAPSNDTALYNSGDLYFQTS